MSESLAAGVGPLGIHVLIVEPGAFRTRVRPRPHAPLPENHRRLHVDPPDPPATGAVDEMDGSQPGDPD
ncbi:MAG: hypothetical protein ACRDM7_02105 [Thermoleophilaceae bacterium]